MNHALKESVRHMLWLRKRWNRRKTILMKNKMATGVYLQEVGSQQNSHVSKEYT